MNRKRKRTPRQYYVSVLSGDSVQENIDTYRARSAKRRSLVLVLLAIGLAAFFVPIIMGDSFPGLVELFLGFGAEILAGVCIVFLVSLNHDYIKLKSQAGSSFVDSENILVKNIYVTVLFVVLLAVVLIYAFATS